jgi:hypothetical protein
MSLYVISDEAIQDLNNIADNARSLGCSLALAS